MKRIIEILILSIILLTSCVSHKESVNEQLIQTHDKSLSDSLISSKNEVYRDSVNIKDSVIYNFIDSIKIIEKFHTEYRWKVRLEKDTIIQIWKKTDYKTVNKTKKQTIIKNVIPTKVLVVIVVLVLSNILCLCVIGKKIVKK